MLGNSICGDSEYLLSNPTCATYCVVVLVHFSCSNRIQLTGWLIKHRNLFFSQFWMLGRPRSSSQTDSVTQSAVRELTSWFIDGHLPTVSSHGGFIYKDTNPTHEDSTPHDHCLPKFSLPKTITVEIRLQHMNLRETQMVSL